MDAVVAVTDLVVTSSSTPGCNASISDCGNDEDALLRSWRGMELTGLLMAVTLFTLIIILLSYLIILISRRVNKRSRDNYQPL